LGEAHAVQTLERRGSSGASLLLEISIIQSGYLNFIEISLLVYRKVMGALKKFVFLKLIELNNLLRKETGARRLPTHP
jgi:hypothetical protein